MISILFFASVRESLGCEQTTVVLPADAQWDLERLRQHLLLQLPGAQALAADNIIVALNQAKAAWSSPVADGDEVAFYPPVTGG